MSGGVHRLTVVACVDATRLVGLSRFKGYHRFCWETIKSRQRPFWSGLGGFSDCYTCSTFKWIEMLLSRDVTHHLASRYPLPFVPSFFSHSTDLFSPIHRTPQLSSSLITQTSMTPHCVWQTSPRTQRRTTMPLRRRSSSALFHLKR